MRGRLRPRPHASGHNCHSKIGQNIQKITHVMPVESIEHVVQARLVPAGRADLRAGGCQRCQMGPSHHHVQTGRARPHRVLTGIPNASECDCDTCCLSEHKLARAVSLLCASRSSDVDLPRRSPRARRWWARPIAARDAIKRSYSVKKKFKDSGRLVPCARIWLYACWDSLACVTWPRLREPRPRTGAPTVDSISVKCVTHDG